MVMALLVALSYLWLGREFALGVLVGGVVAVVNFHLLHHALKGTLERAAGLQEGERHRAKAFFAFRQILRYFVMLAVIYMLVSASWVDIFGLVLGLSTVVLTLVLAGINEAIKLKKKEANPSHGTSHPVS